MVLSLPTPAEPASENLPYTTGNNRAWATSGDGTALSDEVSSRWLAQSCPGRPGEHDDNDRLALKYAAKSEAAK